jgi:hypothetical protein
MASDKKKHIELKHYKVLLLQMATRIVGKVCETGLKPSSKRNHLASQISDLSRQLERELKRDVTLKESTDAKASLYQELYTGGIPDWLLDVIFHALVEESHKLNKRSA